MSASWTVWDVVDYLCNKGVGAVPVVDGAEVVGVFSERDLMQRVIFSGLDPRETQIRDVMTRDVVHVSLDDTFLDAKARMAQHNIRHLVVLDRHQHLQGFISLRELSELALAESNHLISRLNDSYYGTPGARDA